MKESQHEAILAHRIRNGSDTGQGAKKETSSLKNPETSCSTKTRVKAHEEAKQPS